MINEDWWIYEGTKTLEDLPAPPPWRRLTATVQRGEKFEPNEQEKQMVNAALYLRRPLLITGKPGVGKTSLAYAVAHKLGLKILRWSITTQTTLQDGLYSYDAIGRLQDASLAKNNSTAQPNISKYLHLGSLGTALADSKEKLHVLLIDEIDKSDIDLPNNLLHIFEEGGFPIPELERLDEEKQEIFTYDKTKTVTIENGKVHCHHFPLVIMTSNGEREFPPAFLRRCLRLEMSLPDENKLKKIITAHFGEQSKYQTQIDALVEQFIKLRDEDEKEVTTDQLLNAFFLKLNNVDVLDDANLLDALWQSLSDFPTR
ncbi:MoxR family ATPase [Candidatus Albibeggiatoa sp. nov. NOAA]|uniref:AAA family ATPase n=1 Tax=Candidatus Albibeggiatoa sp. nov. NOAA TaxID=3162724 RepID=UPI0032F2DAAD|nr:MoxR family ATPase [Thiotrichaceae bacterium]